MSKIVWEKKEERRRREEKRREEKRREEVCLSDLSRGRFSMPCLTNRKQKINLAFGRRHDSTLGIKLHFCWHMSENIFVRTYMRYEIGFAWS